MHACMCARMYAYHHIITLHVCMCTHAHMSLHDIVNQTAEENLSESSVDLTITFNACMHIIISLPYMFMCMLAHMTLHDMVTCECVYACMYVCTHVCIPFCHYPPCVYVYACTHVLTWYCDSDCRRKSFRILCRFDHNKSKEKHEGKKEKIRCCHIDRESQKY